MFGFKSLFESDLCHTLESRVNPASGLPMIENAEIDIAGNLYGTDSAFDDFSPTGSTGCDFDD
jgi:hypothetical protein